MASNELSVSVTVSPGFLKWENICKLAVVVSQSREALNRVFLSLNSGEGNGTPLQYSCLENPMDGGTW